MNSYSRVYKSVLKFSDPRDPPDKCRACPVAFVFLMSLFEILVLIAELFTTGDESLAANGDEDNDSSLELFIEWDGFLVNGCSSILSTEVLCCPRATTVWTLSIVSPFITADFTLMSEVLESFRRDFSPFSFFASFFRALCLAAVSPSSSMVASFAWLVLSPGCTGMSSAKITSFIWAMSWENVSSGGLWPGKTQTGLLSYRS